MYLAGEFRDKETIAAAIGELKNAGFGPETIDVFSTEPVEFERGVLDRPSRTVRASKSSIRWKVRPRPRRDRAGAPLRVRSWCANSTRPPLGRRRPEHALNVVVLPAPFGPIRPVMRPVGAISENPSTA